CLALSIDARAQYAVEAELQAAIQTFGALGAAGVVMDVHTGEILALASLPDFDPNSPPAPDDEVLFNRAAQGVYEMGSTFKTFTTAMVLDSGKAGLNTLFDARAPLAVGRFRISDFH
ncbi:MAG TPA: penicillin-binding protein, partial [Alphaproteobacteria bacterium]|nr:penicillin-binding protein [Alphaproteobacteria bacterium]